MVKVAECDGLLWEVVSVASDFVTGQELVVLRHHRTISEILDNGCKYGEISQWVISIEKFREMFRWHDDEVEAVDNG